MLRRSIFRLSAVLLGLAIFLPNQAEAASDAAIDLSSATLNTFNTGAVLDDRVVGWEFTTNSEITVTDVGYLDLPQSGGLGPDGLLQAHEVGIFTASGTLLVSATVPSASGGTLQGNFRYVSVAPTVLASGQTYVAAALDLTLGGLNDRQVVQGLNVAYDSRINFVDARVLFPSSTLALPTTVISGQNDGWFGPSFLVLSAPIAAVPAIGPLGLATLTLLLAANLIIRSSR